MIVTTVEEQNRLARVIRKVGGVDNLVKLESHRRALVERGHAYRIEVDDKGIYRVVDDGPLPPPQVPPSRVPWWVKLRGRFVTLWRTKVTIQLRIRMVIASNPASEAQP